jgi:hypothetical protein
MSELTLFQSGSALPAHLRRGELSGLTKSLMGGGSSKRISVEGSVFRMLVGGKEVAVNEDRAMQMCDRYRAYGTVSWVKGTVVYWIETSTD